MRFPSSGSRVGSNSWEKAARPLDMAHRRRLWDSLLRGLLSNMQERDFAAERWPELCPVLFSMPGGVAYSDALGSPAHGCRMGSVRLSRMTRGDAYVEENFDIHAGNWRQDPGQPLSCLVVRSLPAALCRLSTNFGEVPSATLRRSRAMSIVPSVNV